MQATARPQYDPVHNWKSFWPRRFAPKAKGIAVNIACRRCNDFIMHVQVMRTQEGGSALVQPATKFEMVINRKTAKALGRELSPMLLATADEVVD